MSTSDPTIKAILIPVDKPPRIIETKISSIGTLLSDGRDPHTDHVNLTAMEPKYALGMFTVDRFDKNDGRNLVAEKILRKLKPWATQEIFGSVLIYDDNAEITPQTWTDIRNFRLDRINPN